ncbi:hypothetical protein FF38_13618 [Lucilia cuprina]|uniref:Uncharacterized protein n=1 Tax=Lucilia cuprina TaxID=7375 RepID=A0A0L0CAA4_LUCCU|nr:hypothetical protein CVS40_12304 [Lucilia cuprina]KNC29155.1 hypothetical protein FF38_13618 [Lucilia cuprina]
MKLFLFVLVAGYIAAGVLADPEEPCFVNSGYATLRRKDFH